MKLMLFALSWLLNVALVSLMIAVFDKAVGTEIEENQGIAAFLIFVIPTLIEAISYYFTGQPFMASL